MRMKKKEDELLAVSDKEERSRPRKKVDCRGPGIYMRTTL